MITRKIKKVFFAVISFCATFCLIVGGIFLSPLTAKAEIVGTEGSLSLNEMLTVSNATATTDITHGSTIADGVAKYKIMGTNTYKTYYPITYKGLTVTSDTTYSGRFNTTFIGGTTLNYKFPGSATDASKNGYDVNKFVDANGNYAYSMGDGDGDFYFKVTSATNPNHTFTYKMTAVGLTPANVSASAGQYQNARQYVVATNTDSGKVMYSSVNKNTNAAQAGSAVSNLALNMFPFDYFNNSESTVTSKNATAPSISLQIYQQTNGNWAVKTHFSRKRGGEWYSWMGDIAIFNGSNMPKWDFSDGYTIEFGSDYATGSDICFTSVNGWNFSKDITKDGQVDMDISYNGTINEDGNIYLRKGQSLDTFTETKTVLYTSAWKKSFETNVYMPESLSDVSSWEVGTYSPTLQLERFAEEYPSFQKQF